MTERDPIRRRVAAAIVRDGHVLMVRERGLDDTGRHEGVTYWTLPGGGIDEDETPELAVIREVAEEVGLLASNPRYLFDFPYVSGWTACYAVDTNDAEPVMGVEVLDCDCPRIVGLDWFQLAPSSSNGTPIPTLLLAGQTDLLG